MHAYQIILILTSFLFVFLTFYSVNYSNSRGSLIFGALMLAFAFYSFGYAFELGSRSLDDIQFWMRIQYIGITAIPTLWLIFALQFTGKKKWLTPGIVALLVAISFSTFLIQYTNNHHHWFYESVDSNFSGKYQFTILVKGPWYWFLIVYTNIAILLGNLLFLDLFLKSSLLYRRQALIMLIGSLGPWLGHLAYLFGLTPNDLDTSPILLATAGIIYAWGMYHYQMLDVVPIATEHVLHNLREGIVVLDRNNRVIHYNPAANEISGKFNKEAIGKFIDKDFNEMSRIISPLIIGKSDIALFVIPLETATRSYQVRVSPVRNRRKKLQGWTVIFNEITELQKIEKDLRESEKKYESLNATKDKFFRIISHDLKNPFHQLLGLTDLLIKDLPAMKQDDIAEIIQMIHSAASSGSKLLENLLIWANAQTDNISYLPEKLNLVETINQSIHFCEGLAINKEINLKSTVADGLYIHADKNMLDLILRNLITNAIKFTFRQGMVTVSAREENHQIIISVMDNGTGISKEDIDKLFKIEKIYSSPGTEKEKGTGLGLLLCWEFVEKNKGSIRVESELGKGSEFIISFPAYEKIAE